VEKPDRPPFGFVFFSAPKFTSAAHAANYATKYVMKAPRQGWPDWVLDRRGHTRRYWTSRGFWGGGARRGMRPEGEAGAQSEEGGDERVQRERSTIRERLKKCGRHSLLFRVRESYDDDGKLLTPQYEMVLQLPWKLDEVAELLGVRVVKRRLMLMPGQAGQLAKLVSPGGCADVEHCAA
jgi:hypothetical protein